MLSVFLAEDSFVYWYLPVDAKAVVLDADTSISLWGIEIVALVLENGCLGENGKAVGKTTWHEELAMVVLCQFYGYMLAVCG